MTNNKIYSDLDLDFTAHPISGDVSIKYNEEAVKRSIRNLVQMSIHEKPFHPEIRSNIRKLLFENFNNTTAFAVQQEIEDIIRGYEPRVKLLGVNVTANIDSNYLNVSINFRVISFPSLIHGMSIPLERIR
jgi:phage baseplate assembly protein W